MTVPTGLSVSGSPITTSGTLAVSFASGYSIPTTTKQGNWDTAYGWGNHASAGYLTAHQTIKQNGITGATRNCYASCSTAAGTAAKTADVTSGTVTLEAGLRVTVKFANANSASNPTLNINSTGAKNIFHKGSRITTGGNKALLAGAVDFVYDGTQWHLVGNYIDNNSGGTVTSVGMTVPTGLSVSGSPVTGSGTLAVSLASGYSIPTTTKQSNWDTAYGWGNHASAGYLTSHQSLSLITATSATSTTENTSDSTNTTTYLNLLGGGALKDSIKVTGSGSVSVKANGGTLTISGTSVTDSTVQGWGYTKGIKFGLPGGGAYNSNTSTLTPVSLTSGRNLKDSSWNDITFSPSSGTCTINAVPVYRQDATWGDWVFYWEGMDDQTHQPNDTKGGLLWKNGEFVMAGNFHVANSLAFYQSGTYVAGSINTVTIGASFYADNNGGGSTNSSAFYINVSTAAGGWNGHETFRFDKDGIYAYPASGRTGITGWFINESDALTNSEIDTILANAT